jgi:hypothetical protein
MLNCVDVKVEEEVRKADVLDALNCAKAVGLGRRDYLVDAVKFRCRVAIPRMLCQKFMI